MLSDLLGKRLPEGMPVEWMDIKLHNTPKKLAAALQERIDAIAEPSNVVVGYGLCGNGLVGVRSGPHTLIVPRMHDCVAIFLGSHQRYLERFFASANTYYLTKGWIDARDEPLRLPRLRARLRRGDGGLPRRDEVGALPEAVHGRLLAGGAGRLPAGGDAGRGLLPGAVRHGVRGDDRHVGADRGAGPHDERVDAGDSEFVVVSPGGEITTEMFMRPGEGAPQPMGRGNPDHHDGGEMTPEQVLAHPAKVLTRDQRVAYFRDGFLLLPKIVPDEWIRRLRAVSDEFVEKSRSIAKSDTVFDLEPFTIVPTLRGCAACRTPTSTDPRRSGIRDAIGAGRRRVRLLRCMLSSTSSARN